MTEIIHAGSDQERGFAQMASIDNYSTNAFNFLNHTYHIKDRKDVKQFDEFTWQFDDQKSCSSSVATDDTIIVSYRPGDFKNFLSKF